MSISLANQYQAQKPNVDGEIWIATHSTIKSIQYEARKLKTHAKDKFYVENP